MIRATVLAIFMAISTHAYAKKNCTSEPKSKWMKEKAFQEMLVKQGYTIDKFKTPGTCYEIYGKNAKGQKVEIYFNPVNGDIVKSEIE